VPVYFVDTSALAKRYVSEAGSAWVRALLAPASGNEVFIARITAVELIAAVTRRERGGSLTPADASTARAEFRTHLDGEYQIVELTVAVVQSAMAIAEAQGLRGYDAVRLAVALQVSSLSTASGRPPVTLISSDADLNAAAMLAGLTVDDRNRHP
jgi:predicted nucleic acid-binding protein